MKKTNKNGTQRGMNPNSHGNNKKSPERRTIQKEVTLYDKHWQIAYELGNKEYSRGLRVLADMAISAKSQNIDSVLSEIKIALQRVLNGDESFDNIENVLRDLEDIQNASKELTVDNPDS